jgi:hypothetical protein
MKKYKRGDRREDGMIFWRYNPRYNNGEYWITKDKFESMNKVELERVKKWQIDNHSKRKTYIRYWNKLNYYSIRKKQGEYFRNRMKSDKVFRLIKNVRHRISRSFLQKGYTKKSQSYHIIGCSWADLIKHIESQFKDGMSWENRHLWHIDHIIPIAIAKTEEEVFRLNHYTNLRPLWAHENFAKKDKITPEALLWTFCKNLDIKSYFSNHQYV